MRGNSAEQVGPRTEAVRRALRRVNGEAAAADLLFLEHWEISPRFRHRGNAAGKPDPACQPRACR